MRLVNVIIPCYNYANYLRQCVESVLDQRGVELRVLIIDDASPDNTAAVAADLTALDKRLEFRRHIGNRGHIATYNEGLEWASGDFTLLLSADDLLAPGALQRASYVMESDPEIGFVYGRQVEFFGAKPDPVDLSSSQLCDWERLEGPRFLQDICTHGKNIVGTPTAVVRTSLQKRIGGYNASLPHSGDMEMWLRFATHAPIGVVNNVQAFYRRHDRNMTMTYRGVGDLRQRKEAFTMLFQNCGHFICDVSRLEALASHSLAWEAFWSASHAFDRDLIGLCREYLDYATELDPFLHQSSEWLRMRMKLWMGPVVWRMLRPFAEWQRSALAGSKRHQKIQGLATK